MRIYWWEQLQEEQQPAGACVRVCQRTVRPASAQCSRNTPQPGLNIWLIENGFPGALKKNKNKKKSFGMFFCDIRCIARELRGYSDQEGPKPRETADYMGSQESDTCLIMNSDAQRGPSFFTGLHSRKQNCTTHTRWGSPRSYLKAQTHTQCKSPCRGRALAPYPKISPAASKPFHRGRENA